MFLKNHYNAKLSLRVPLIEDMLLAEKIYWKKQITASRKNIAHPTCEFDFPAVNFEAIVTLSRRER